MKKQKTAARQSKSAVTRRLFMQGGKVRLFLGITVAAGGLLSILIVVQAHYLSLLIDDIFLKNGSGGWGWLLALLAVIVGRAVLNWVGARPFSNTSSNSVPPTRAVSGAAN